MNANPASRIRSISLFTATCIVIANMIGTGVFVSLGFQVGDLPSGFAIVALWLIGGVTALCGALVYGELAAALPRSGGEYHLLSASLHPALGFLAGWISVTVGFAAPVAVAAMAFGTYAHYAFAAAVAHTSYEHLATVVGPVSISVGLTVAMTLVHLFGTKTGSTFQDGSTVLKVILILVFIGAGVLMHDAQPISFLPHAGDGHLMMSAPFAVSLIYVMYAYSGWNATTYIVGEVRNPGRNLPLSVLFGTLIVTVLYVSLNAIFLHSTPIPEIAKAGPGVAYVSASHIFGEHGGQWMAALIAVGLVSSVSAMTWIGPRVSVAMGEDWSLLRFLAHRTRGGVPVAAILIQSAIAILLIVTAKLDTVTAYIQFSLSICSFLTVFGVFVLRRRRPDLPRPCKAWGYPVTPLIFLAVNFWMLWYTLQDKPKESLVGLGTITLGFVIYLCSPKKPTRASFESAHEEPIEPSAADKIALPQTVMQSAPPQP